MEGETVTGCRRKCRQGERETRRVGGRVRNKGKMRKARKVE